MYCPHVHDDSHAAAVAALRASPSANASPSGSASGTCSAHCRATLGRGNIPTICTTSTNQLTATATPNSAVEPRCDDPIGKRTRARAPRSEIAVRANWHQHRHGILQAGALGQKRHRTMALELTLGMRASDHGDRLRWVRSMSVRNSRAKPSPQPQYLPSFLISSARCKRRSPLQARLHLVFLDHLARGRRGEDERCAQGPVQPAVSTPPTQY